MWVCLAKGQHDLHDSSERIVSALLHANARAAAEQDVPRGMTKGARVHQTTRISGRSRGANRSYREPEVSDPTALSKAATDDS